MAINVRRKEEFEENDYLFTEMETEMQPLVKTSFASTGERDPLRLEKKGWKFEFVAALAILSAIFLLLVLSVTCFLFFLISWVLGLLGFVSMFSSVFFFAVLFSVGACCLKVDYILIIEMYFSGIIGFLCCFVVEFSIVGVAFIVLYSIGLVDFKEGVSFDIPSWLKFVLEFCNAFFVEALVEETTKYFLIYRVKHRIEKPYEFNILSMASVTGFVLVEDLLFCLTRYLLFLNELEVGIEMFWVMLLLTSRLFFFYILSISLGGIIGLKLWRFEKVILLIVVVFEAVLLHGFYQVSIMFGVIVFEMYKNPLWSFIGMSFALIVLVVALLYHCCLSCYLRKKNTEN